MADEEITPEELRARMEKVLAGMDSSGTDHLKFAEEVVVERLPTPSIGLTAALGGGLGMGRQVVVYGPRAAGKSSLLLQQVAVAQRLGKVCAWFDVEKAFDKEWAARLGVDPSTLLVSEHGTVQGLVNQGTSLMRAGVDVIIVDSMTALMPPAYLNDKGELKDFEDTGAMGSLARGLSSAMSQMNYENNNTLVVFISQTRQQAAGKFAFRNTFTSGQAPGFYSSQILHLFSADSDKFTITGDVRVGDKLISKPIGREVHYTIDKNRIGPPFHTGKYNFYYEGDFVGIDIHAETLALAVEKGIVRKAGNWYAYEDERIGNGEKNAAKFLRDNPDTFNAVVKRCYE